MNKAGWVRLGRRGVIAVGGGDARDFLQNLISNDVDKVSENHAIYAALLTPQGKFLFDFFVLSDGRRLLLDCEAARLEALIKRLSLYRLRADVQIEDLSGEHAVFAVFGPGWAAALGLGPESGGAFAGGQAFVDPRLPEVGARIVAPPEQVMGALNDLAIPEAREADYDKCRLELGLPDGSRDLEIDRTILLEANFEELNGVDFQKGCFVGQEVTARTKYRGLIKKRLMRVDLEGPAPAPDTPILLYPLGPGRHGDGVDPPGGPGVRRGLDGG
jgi:hypothetical protein